VRAAEPLPPDRDLVAARDDEMAAAEARRVFDLIMRVAVIALSVGASSAESIAMALRIADAYDIHVHVDITNTSVIVTQHRSLDDDPITSLRVVRTRTPDYQRLERLERLVDDISRRTIGLDDARGRLDSLVTAPRLYRKWFVTVNMGVMGAAMAALYGASVWDVIIAFLATCLVDVAVQALARRRVANFFAQAVGGAIPTAVALGMMLLTSVTGMKLDLSPSLVVAAGMISLLAGTGAVSAAQDALDGYYVTSSGRFLEVIMQTGGIIFGVMATLWAGLKLGVPGYISPTLAWTSADWVQILASAIAAVGFGATAHSGAAHPGGLRGAGSARLGRISGRHVAHRLDGHRLGSGRRPRRPALVDGCQALAGAAGGAGDHLRRPADARHDALPRPVHADGGPAGHPRA
jgi:uncharacterized membrane protein YjjP (DUF1212 family)